MLYILQDQGREGVQAPRTVCKCFICNVFIALVSSVDFGCGVDLSHGTIIVSIVVVHNLCHRSKSIHYGSLAFYTANFSAVLNCKINPFRILFRLYWLPCKAIYASGHVSKNFMRPAPHYLFPNILLWVLYVLHWYWFHFIVKMVIQVVFGKKVNDNREYEEPEEQGKRVKKD